MIKKNLHGFRSFIDGDKLQIAIISHPRPDADALGSALAMNGYLKTFGHHCTVIMPTDWPNFLTWMEDADKALNFESPDHKDQATNAVLTADLVICVDFGKLKRIDALGAVVKSATGKKMLIDHHIDPDDFADFVMWDSEAAATCELIYDMIVELGDKDRISKAVAECIYSGIMTDTGSFQHPTTNAKVMHTVAELYELGINTGRVHALLFDNQTEDRLRFLGYMLSEKLKVLPEYRTAYFGVSEQELKRFNTLEGDTEGIVNYALSIEGIVFAIFAIDRGDFVKYSFRSVGDFAVNELAAKHFDGGGHKNAAGGKVDNVDVETALKMVLDILPQYKEKLLSIEEFV